MVDKRRAVATSATARRRAHSRFPPRLGARVRWQLLAGIAQRLPNRAALVKYAWEETHETPLYHPENGAEGIVLRKANEEPCRLALGFQGIHGFVRPKAPIVAHFQTVVISSSKNLRGSFDDETAQVQGGEVASAYKIIGSVDGVVRFTWKPNEQIGQTVMPASCTRRRISCTREPSMVLPMR